jgi:hypothetical protein
MTNREKKIFLIKELSSFMTDNKCLKRFIFEFNLEKHKSWRNCYLYGNYDNVLKYINDFTSNKICYKHRIGLNLRKIPIEYFFTYSFQWIDTIEGRTYWNDIAVKWGRRVNTFGFK